MHICYISIYIYKYKYIYIYVCVCVCVYVGKKVQRNITSLTTSFANAFQVN